MSVIPPGSFVYATDAPAGAGVVRTATLPLRSTSRLDATTPYEPVTLWLTKNLSVSELVFVKLVMSKPLRSGLVATVSDES